LVLGRAGGLGQGAAGVGVVVKESCGVKESDNSVVVMDNKMVRAKYGKLTDVEARFIFFMISQIKYSDVEFKTFRFSIGYLLKELDVPWKNNAFLFKVLKKVLEKTIAIPDVDGISMFPWFQKTRIENKGMIEVKFNDDLKPYLLELRHNFTKAELALIINMKNHTRRVYLMCKQYLNVGQFEKDIAAFRDELELGKAYGEYKYMARNILAPAEKEINELSDIRISFKPIRVGRSYTRLGFKIWAAPTNNKAAAKVNAVKTKHIEDYRRREENRRKTEAERQEQIAKEDKRLEEDIERKWEKQCKELEPFLTRKSKVWLRCLDKINEKFNDGLSFYSWFYKGTELFFDAHRNAYILTPTTYAADTIQQNYLNLIKEIFMNNKIDFATVKIVTSDIKTELSTAAAVAAADESTGESNAESAAEDYGQQPDLFGEAEQTAFF
jgi:plasmid replication initiation protein